ncbi:hypothetical protein ABT083_13285 [Streptomyces goshikiensis]|uniref:hypothetical protein n=1 Tax=Streptomyces goshikiensis TaxID=1942 RepID=UPI003318487F
MIPHVHPRGFSATDALAEALGRSVSAQKGLPDHTVVAHWPGLDYYTLDDEQRTWTVPEPRPRPSGPLLRRPSSNRGAQSPTSGASCVS